MKKNYSTAWLLFALVCAVASTLLILSMMVTQPGHVFNELGGDTGKNYFTFLYQSMYGKGFWFDGMNYPYGEHIIYADGQPVISLFLQLFQPLDAHMALAAMNLLISASYVLAILFTYKTLNYCGMKPFLAIFFACLINLLSPQVMRIRGHFGMAYLYPIPMLFYWSMLYHYTLKWRYAFYLFILGLITALIHLYLGALVLVWLAFYVVGYFIFAKSWKSGIGPRETWKAILKHVLPIFIALSGLFLFIKLFIALTDPVTDRPVFPLNMLENVTHFNEIFTSPFSPFWQFAHNRLGFNPTPYSGEGYTYIGLTAMFTLTCAFVFWLINKFRHKTGGILPAEQEFSKVWLFIAIAALLMAMGVPFIWNMRSLLNYLSIFKQFRAMGRFSWIFYYITAIYVALIINKWHLKLVAARRPLISYLLLFSALIVWSFDVSGYISYVNGIVQAGRKTSDEFFLVNDMKWPEYLASKGFKPADFQAILLCPAFFSGSEKLWVGGDPSLPMSIGIRASIEMQLPIIDVMMSRTSWSLTEKQVKIAGGRFTDKPMLRDLKSNKPFLMIQFDESKLDFDEQYILKSCDFIGNHFRANIYACYPERIIANDKINMDSVKAILPFMKIGDSCITQDGSWYVDHFDNHRSEEVFFGKGACAYINKSDTELATIPVKITKDSELYEFSCWFLLSDENFYSPYFTLKIYDSSWNLLGDGDVLTNRSVDNHKKWYRDSKFFYVKPNWRYIKCILYDNPYLSYLAMDELMFRPATSVIISKAADGRAMVNNHLINH